MSNSGSDTSWAADPAGGDGKARRAEHCPACGGGNLVPWKRATFDGSRLAPEQIKITHREYGRIWDLSRCRDCGHRFADPAPDPDMLASLYGRVQDPRYEAEAPGRARNFLRLLKRLETFAPDKGLLCDIGAATGILMDLARRRGWDPEGVEASGWASEVARQKYGLAVEAGDFLTMDLPPARYSAVAMVDIIEHLARPLAAASKACRILKPGGILCLVTPDVGSAAARLAGRRWWHFRPGHIGYFTLSSLVVLLHRAGFSILELRRYAWTFSLRYLISRLSGGRRKHPRLLFCRRFRYNWRSAIPSKSMPERYRHLEFLSQSAAA